MRHEGSARILLSTNDIFCSRSSSQVWIRPLYQHIPYTDLHRAHRITPASQSSPSDDSAIDLQSHATPKRPRLDQSIIPKAKVKAVQELSVGFVIDSDVPFTIFEHKFLKELFYQFDHELALQIPWSSSSITRELQKIFESKADIIKAELGSALTKIHISFDLWTSLNRLAIMAVFAHFIDKFGNQQSRLLALPTPSARYPQW